MKQISRMLLDAIYSGYWTTQDWCNWSDRFIREQESPAWWVIQLSLAVTHANAADVLTDYLASELYSDDTNHKDIVLGYLFLTYQEQRLSIQQLLARAWEETESVENTGMIKNDEILRLYKQLTASANSEHQSAIIKENVDALFRQCADLAARELAVIKRFGYSTS